MVSGCLDSRAGINSTWTCHNVTVSTHCLSSLFPALCREFKGANCVVCVLYQGWTYSAPGESTTACFVISREKADAKYEWI